MMSSQPKTPDAPVSVPTELWRFFPPWLVSFGCHAVVLTLLAQISIAQFGAVEPGSSRGLLVGLAGGEVSTLAPTAEEPAPTVSLPRTEQAASTAEEGPAPNAVPRNSASQEEESASGQESLLAYEGAGSIIGPRLTTAGAGTGRGRRSGSGTGKQGSGNQGTGTGSGNRLSGGGSGEGGGGGPGRAGFLGLNAVAQRVVYVIDCSASMSQNHRLEVARRELLKSISQLEDRQHFEIIFYRDKPLPMSAWDRAAGLRKVSPEARQMAAQFAEGIDSSGGTDHMPALRLALAHAPDVIFFLTDASEPRLTEKEIREFANACRGKIHVYTIEFGILAEAGMIPSFLKKLAERTGGDYRYFDVTRFGNN